MTTEASGPAGTAGRLAVSLDVTAVPEQAAGAGRYTTNLAAGLALRADLDLTLLSRESDVDRWRRLAPSARLEAVAPASRPMRLLWEQARLPRVLARLPVQVHHGPHYTMPESASLPRVVTIHDLTFFDHPEWHERSKAVFFRRAVRAAAAQAEVLVCVSQTTARRLAELCPASGQVRVVPHGVDHSRFRPAPFGTGVGDGIRSGGRGPGAEPAGMAADQSHEALRHGGGDRPTTAFGPDGTVADQLAGLGVRAPYVAFMGTIEPRKDVPTLVRAFDRMCPAHDGLSLVLAGAPGWGEPTVAKAIEEARHRGRILRLGYVPEAAVPALLQQAAAVAYPALEEGFGLPVLEALACSSPLVTTSGTVMEELADGAALLVEPGDADGLAGALDMLVRGDQGLARRRQRGLQVAARYTWEASVEAHVQAYRVALDQARPGASRLGQGRLGTQVGGQPRPCPPSAR